MHTYLKNASSLFAVALLGTGLSSAQVVNDPYYVTGSDAIDPAGRMEVTFSAAGSTAKSTLTGLTGFGAVQDFGGFTGNASVGSGRIYTFSNPDLPAIRFSFSGEVNTTVTAAMNNASFATSRDVFASALRLQPWTVEGNSITLTIDFGAYSEGAFSEAKIKEGVSAVGFTLSGQFENLASGISITYLDAASNTLSSQVLAQSGYGTTTVAGYTGYQITTGQNPISSVVITYELGSSSAVFGFDDLGFTPYQSVPEPAHVSMVLGASLILLLLGRSLRGRMRG